MMERADLEHGDKIRPALWRELYLMLSLTVLFSSVGGLLAYKSGLRGRELLVTLTTFILLIGGYCLLSTRIVIDWLRARFARTPALVWIAVGVLLIPYLLFAFGTKSENLNGATRLVIFLGLPTFLLFTLREKKARMYWQDALAILAIWLPFDFRLLKNIWIGKVTYGFNTLVA